LKTRHDLVCVKIAVKLQSNQTNNESLKFVIVGVQVAMMTLREQRRQISRASIKAWRKNRWWVSSLSLNSSLLSSHTNSRICLRLFVCFYCWTFHHNDYSKHSCRRFL